MNQRNLAIFNLAKDYLLSFELISEEMIEKQLCEWKQHKPHTMPALFKALLVHAKNRQGMPNSIGRIEDLHSLLFEFSPIRVCQAYSTWEDLFDAIVTSDYTPPGRMQKGNNRNFWVIYCKSILSSAAFLSKYSRVDEFTTFVEGFYTNEDSRLALPLLLEHEIFGFGFALACDFLKETGYPEFIKPDTHINDIAYGIGITTSNSPFQVFKDVITYCRTIQKLPYEVDKLFWLVGSGNFYLSKAKISTSKTHFIQLVNEHYPL